MHRNRVAHQPCCWHALHSWHNVVAGFESLVLFVEGLRDGQTVQAI